MADTRPWGFRDYVQSHGFHTIYLAKPIRGRPIKVGIAEDPERRLANLQNGNFEEPCFHPEQRELGSNSLWSKSQ